MGAVLRGRLLTTRAAPSSFQPTRVPLRRSLRAKCDHATQTALTLAHRMIVVSRLDDPARSGAAGDDADMAAPNDDGADGWTAGGRAVPRPVARKIERAVGDAEIVSQPPAAPGARTRIAAAHDAGRNGRRVGKCRACGAAGKSCTGGRLRSRPASEMRAFYLAGISCDVNVRAVMTCEGWGRDGASKRERDDGCPSYHLW